MNFLKNLFTRPIRVQWFEAVAVDTPNPRRLEGVLINMAQMEVQQKKVIQPIRPNGKPKEEIITVKVHMGYCLPDKRFSKIRARYVHVVPGNEIIFL